MSSIDALSLKFTYATGGYVGPDVSFLDAYESEEDKLAASLRLLNDTLTNRKFAQKAYTNLDFNEAIARILSSLVNKEEK
jgi:hypothetical protein